MAGQKLTKADVERIKWLTEQNLKHLPKRHDKAAEEMAIAQVWLEKSGKDD